MAYLKLRKAEKTLAFIGRMYNSLVAMNARKTLITVKVGTIALL